MLELRRCGVGVAILAMAASLLRGQSDVPAMINLCKAEGAACYERTIASAKESGNRKLEAGALFFAGMSYLNSDDYAKAIARFEGSAAINKELGQESERASALTNRAAALWSAGESARALDGYREALAIRKSLNDREGLARTWGGVASAQWQLGDLAAALEGFRQALAYWREIKHKFGEADTRNSLGLVYAQLGDAERAAGEYELALGLWRELGDKAREAYTVNNLCYSSLGRGEFAKAAGECERGLALAETGNDSRATAYLLQNLANARSGLKQFARALELSGRSLALKRELGDRWGESFSLESMGESHMGLRNWPEARKLLDEALALAEAVQDRAGQIRSLGARARLRRDQGDLPGGRNDIGKALGLIEASRSSLASQDLRASYFASQRDYYAFEIDLLVRLGRTAESLEAAERARGRLLLDRLSDTLAEVRNGVDPALLARERAIRLRLNTGAGGKAKPAELAKLLGELREVEEQVRRASPKYAALAEPPLLKEAAIRGLLDRDSVLAEYFIGEDRSFLWIVTNVATEVSILPGRRSIESVVLGLSAKIAAKALWDGGEARKMLLERAIAKLGAGRRLVIAPDGPLEVLPFAALIPDLETVILPSASALSLARSRRPIATTKMLAVLADPVFSREDPRATVSSVADSGPTLPRLRFSRREADRIAALVAVDKRTVATDFGAARSFFEQANIGDYRVIHLATHALLDPDRPPLSAIALSDGFFRLHEVFNLNLRARLVTLSACRSAVGKPLAGEGLMSLTRGFLYAGAGSVLAALWDVDDRATAELMVKFYEGLLQRGLTPGAALVAARKSVRGTPGWEHPFYWAGFTLQGEWRRW